MKINPLLKTIKYRGGILTFKLPLSWNEEYEEDGGGTFYEDGDETGTLRLNFLTMAPPPGLRLENGLDFFLSRPIPNDSRLTKGMDGGGVLFFEFKEIGNESELSVYTWHLAHLASPNKVSLAIFTWTILQSQTGKPGYIDEVKMLDDFISNAVF